MWRRIRIMTTLNEETKEFLAIRQEAAEAINPATAKVLWEHGYVTDPYGICSDLSDEEKCIGRNYFARAPGSDVWVSFHDLPESVVDALWRRIEQNDPDGPSFDDPDLPDVKRLVVEILARDDGEPGYAAEVARGIAAKLALRDPG
jgi:hypothetical protein